MSSSGLPSQAFEYIMYNKGLMTEDDYPYNAIVTENYITNKIELEANVKIIHCYYFFLSV